MLIHASCVAGDQQVHRKWYCFKATLLSLLMLSPLVLWLQLSCCKPPSSSSHIWLNVFLSFPFSHSWSFLSFMFACFLSSSSLSLFLTSSTCSRLDLYSMGDCVCHYTATLCKTCQHICLERALSACTLQLAATFTPHVLKLKFKKCKKGEKFAPLPQKWTAEVALVGM